MKLKLLLAHTLGIFIGASIVFYAFTASVIPNISKSLPTDSFFIKLPNEPEKLSDHWEILGQEFLGKQYLFKSYYPFKRDEGYKILENLAQRGYTPAAATLHDYYTNLMDQNTNNEVLFKKYLDQSYKWAKIAAEQGDYFPLSFLIQRRNLAEFKDISDDLNLIDNWLNTTASNFFSIKYMGEYYAKHGDTEKAKHFETLAEEVKNNPRPTPVCSTITPWKGW